MKTIALYGGSFDPPHIGHEAVIKALVKLEYIDQIIVTPTYLNPFKNNFFAPASLRLKWLKELCATMKKVSVSDFEVNKNEKVPTLTTVNHFLQMYENIYLVIGADNLEHLHRWYKYEKLRQKVTFIVVTREDISVPKEYIKLEVNRDVSSSELRNNLKIDKLPKKIANKIVDFYNKKENSAK